MWILELSIDKLRNPDLVLHNGVLIKLEMWLDFEVNAYPHWAAHRCSINKVTFDKAF